MRTLKTWWLRLRSFVWQSRWILLSLGLAVIGVLGLRWDVPGALNLALALVSVALLLVEWRRHVAELRALAFVDRKGDTYADVAATYAGSGRFDLVTVNHEHVVLDRAASAAVASGSVSATLSSFNYILPEELRAGIRFRTIATRRPGTYNDPVLGLDTNVGVEDSVVPDEWRFVPARYWNHLESDLLASKITERHGRPIDSLGRSLYVSSRNQLRDYGDSWLLNAVGTSILAVTTDRRLVVVYQSTLNHSSPGLLAPASGSLEAQDMRGAERLDVASLALHGALRELKEEAQIVDADLAETGFLGMGRWLEKAAKPEFWAIARLNVGSEEVRRRPVPHNERPYTKLVDSLRIRPMEVWDVERPERMVEAKDSALLSIPLLVGLRLMAEEVAKPPSSVGALIRRALTVAN